MWLFRQAAPELRPFFWPALIVKILAGFTLAWLYLYHYQQGDTFLFFRDANQLANMAKKNALHYAEFLWSASAHPEFFNGLTYTTDRALFFTKLLSLLSLATQQQYLWVSVWLSLFSFVGAWRVTKVLSVVFPASANAAVLSFLFVPSVFFWTSGVLKESVAFGALCLLCAHALSLYSSRQHWWLRVGGILFFGWLVWALKYYWLAIFIITMLSGLVVVLVSNRVGLKSTVAQLGVWFVAFAGIAFSVSALHPNFYPERFLSVLVENYYAYTFANAGGGAHYAELQPSWRSVVAYAPAALINGLFRPVLWEVKNPLQALLAIENTVLLLLFIARLRTLRIAPTHRVLIFSVVFYVVILCVFLSLSTPNWGTLSRYRIGFLPFLFFLMLVQNPLVDRWQIKVLTWLRLRRPNA
jgi:hypothetical protein